MSTSPPHAIPPHAAPPHAIHPSWRPSRTALLIAGAAFALGLLLFLLLWLDQRNNTDFYRAPVSPPTGAAPTFDPLPVPLPAGESDAASGMPELGDEVFAERPQIIEQTPPPPPAPPPPRPSEPALVARANPVPVSSPAPRYPAEAARRRESGTVLVRVDVGPDGVPTSTSTVQSSQSRSLDKAALDAVRRWRFQPAVVDGHPTVGSVVVPIAFNLER